MAASLIIEQERGTYVNTFRGRHQGYYAGDFSAQPAQRDGSPRTVEDGSNTWTSRWAERRTADAAHQA
jgi:hypothetical protein